MFFYICETKNKCTTVEPAYEPSRETLGGIGPVDKALCLFTKLSLAIGLKRKDAAPHVNVNMMWQLNDSHINIYW
jgi:hypothetical protein